MAGKRKYPWFKFYADKWLNDSELTLCSTSTRGIWIDAVCRMDMADRCGKLSGTLEQLAKLCRCTVDEMKTAIEDLRDTQTSHVTEDYGVFTLINRRMLREYDEKNGSRKRMQAKRMRDRDAKVTPMLREELRECSAPRRQSTEYRKKNTKKEKAKVAEEIASWVSDSFGQGFALKWGDWILSRMEKKKPKDWKVFFKRQWDKLHTYEEDAACHVLEVSTVNDYIGLVWDKGDTFKRLNGSGDGGQAPTAKKRVSTWELTERKKAIQGKLHDLEEYGQVFNREKGKYEMPPEKAEEWKRLKADLKAINEMLTRAPESD